MDSLAVVIKEPEQVELDHLVLNDPTPDDVVVAIEWSGISTGTERLLWSGRMPHFPGMGYPLVPGYESVGCIIAAASTSDLKVGQRVFVPGANCYGPVRGLFGGAASHIVLPASRVSLLDDTLQENGTILALAATAYHAGFTQDNSSPELIIGHGVLGRLLARIAIAKGLAVPTVWETNELRSNGASDYSVIHPDNDNRRDYRCICDVSGDSTLLDMLIGRLAVGGEIILAGFYADRVGFNFPPAFMREARFRVASQWQKSDLDAVIDLVKSGRLSLDGLITHRSPASDAKVAYRTAFNDPACLKMILDWRHCA